MCGCNNDMWAPCVETVGTLPLQKLKMWNLPEVDLIGGPAQGLVFVVTGPTSGIGREVASALARRGAVGACVVAVREFTSRYACQESRRKLSSSHSTP